MRITRIRASLALLVVALGAACASAVPEVRVPSPGAGPDGGGDAAPDPPVPPVDSGSGEVIDAERDAGPSADVVIVLDLDGGCSYRDPSLGTDGGARLRVMAANTTSGNASVYDTPGINLFRGIKPDIALVQEFKYPAGARALVDVAFGPEFFFAVEAQTGGIPNAIVSRYPIVASGEWEDLEVDDRDFAYARIDVPGPKDLWAVSIHLKTSGSATRNTEATTLVAFVKANVPATDFLVIGGDLNVGNSNEPALAAFAEVAAVRGPAPVDQARNDKTNASRSRRYDWLMASPNLEALRMPARIGASTYCDGLVVDSRVYSPLVEIAPVASGDSNSANMQHMPVVRDFFLGLR
jgi:endonuclease/exonuclease/phosphatase family metal-dependent hydrolase